MRTKFSFYRILLPPLFGLYCSCMALPTENKISQREQEQDRSNTLQHFVNFVKENDKSILKGNSGINLKSDFSPSVRGTRNSRWWRNVNKTRARPSDAGNTMGVFSEWTGLNIQRPRQDAPDFMVKLFHLLSSIHSNRLKNTVITSFPNINLQEHDVSKNMANSNRPHRLVFNGTTLHDKEDIDHAELRMFFSSPKSSPSHSTDGQVLTSEDCLYHIRIYVLQMQSLALQSHTLILSEKQPIKTNSWNGFDVTSAVQKWDPSSLHVIDVKINFVVNENKTDSDKEQADIPKHCVIKAEVDPRDRLDPILVVFSKKVKGKKRHRRSRREAFSGNQESVNVYDSDFVETKGKGYQDIILRNKRRVSHNSHKGKSYTNDTNPQFSSHNLNIKPDSQYRSDVPWVKFIKERLKTHDSLFTNETYASDNIHTDGRLRNPRAKGSLDSETDQFNRQNAHMVSTHRFRREIRRKRSLYRRYSGITRGRRNRRQRNSCRREEMLVYFDEINLRDFIFPIEYQAFQCVGRCYTPIGSHLKPTKHAIIQTLYHTTHPRQVNRACCVPTRLAPISVLYRDDSGEIVYKHTFDGMVAAECGCR